VEIEADRKQAEKEKKRAKSEKKKNQKAKKEDDEEKEKEKDEEEDDHEEKGESDTSDDTCGGGDEGDDSSYAVVSRLVDNIKKGDTIATVAWLDGQNGKMQLELLIVQTVWKRKGGLQLWPLCPADRFCPVGEWRWVHQKKYVEMAMADAKNQVMAVVKWETADASRGKFVMVQPEWSRLVGLAATEGRIDGTCVQW
jgi:hypothetical protein